MDNKQFEAICKMSQPSLKEYVTRKLKKTYEEVIVEDGFVYAQGSFPVLLVAHMDTVHKKLPRRIVYKKGTISSPQGIGGDDRCGIYMILNIIKEHKCSVLFCEDEEIGCIGAEKFCKSKLADELVGKFNYIIELDRKGKNDAVFYECDNPEFEEFITKEFYDLSYGSLSDISYIAPMLETAAVNLSCGYYDAHTTKEYVNIKEMDMSIEQVKKLLARTTKDDVFEYIEGLYGGGLYEDDGYGYYEYRGKGVLSFNTSNTRQDKLYFIFFYDEDNLHDEYQVYANSKTQAIGAFCMDYPYLCYNNVLDIFEE